MRSGSGNGTDRVFANDNPRDWFPDALRLANIRNFRWHDCRHDFCSKLAMKGVNLKAIQLLAGHKTIATTVGYAHLDDGALKAAVDLLTKR